MLKRNIRKYESAYFTLVELLVVISIIMILASLLLPALKSARDSAKKVSCLSDLKQFGIGFGMYVNDYKDHLMPFKNDQEGGLRWNRYYHKYMGIAEYKANTSTQNPNLGRIYCPGVSSLEQQFFYAYAYAMNNNYAASIGATTSTKPPKVTAIKNPTRMLLLSDGLMNWAGSVDYRGRTDRMFPYCSVRFSHPGMTAGALFMDGHVDAFPAMPGGWNSKYVTQTAGGLFTE